MSLTEDVADALARDVIAAAESLGDESLINDIARVIGVSSTTTQEAFMTAVRVRLSEQRARKALAARVAQGPVGAPRELGGARVLDVPDGA